MKVEREKTFTIELSLFELKLIREALLKTRDPEDWQFEQKMLQPINEALGIPAEKATHSAFSPKVY